MDIERAHGLIPYPNTNPLRTKWTWLWLEPQV